MSTLPDSVLNHREAPASAPAYVVGRDGEGHWLAVETHGHGGGIFRDEGSARDYAEFETGRRPGAVAFASEPVSLGLGTPPSAYAAFISSPGRTSRIPTSG